MNMKRCGRCAAFLWIIAVVFIHCSSGKKASMNFLQDTQAPTIQIISPANNSILSGTVLIQVDATDNVAVKSVDLYLNGSVAATDNSQPWEFSWDTSTYEDGVYTLAVKAYDTSGNGSNLYSISVTVTNKLDVTFVNNAFTAVHISFEPNNILYDIDAGASRTWTYDTNPGSITYHADTFGKSSSGTQIGLDIGWNYTQNVTGYQTFTINLNVDSDVFFIYIINNGTSSLVSLYVNYGKTDQTLDNIVIPANGVKYTTGYYKAFSNTEVRMYKQNNPSTYVYWQQGVHFTLPFTVNQSATLQNSFALMGQGNHDSISMSTLTPELPLRCEIQPVRKELNSRGKVLNHPSNIVRE